MGYPTNSHIKLFAIGQKVKEIRAKSLGHMEIVFESGETLRLIAIEEKNELRILATPFAENGEVKQSTVIMAKQ